MRRLDPERKVAITTDGTAALVPSAVSEGRNIYATGVTFVGQHGRPVLTSTEPVSISLTYSDTHSFVLAAGHYPAARQYHVTYADLPASWYAADGILPGQITVRNLTATGIPGSPVPWNLSGDRAISVMLRSGQQVLVEYALP